MPPRPSSRSMRYRSASAAAKGSWVWGEEGIVAKWRAGLVSASLRELQKPGTRRARKKGRTRNAPQHLMLLAQGSWVNCTPTKFVRGRGLCADDYEFCRCAVEQN